MTTTDITTNSLVINTLTQQQYESITPSATELYLTTDNPLTNSEIIAALGYTPYNATNPSGYQANVIESVKVNGTALTVINKAVDIVVPASNNITAGDYLTIGYEFSEPVTNSSLSTVSSNWRNPVYDGSQYVMINGSGYVTTTTDGITWTSPTKLLATLTNTNWQCLLYDGSKFIALNIMGETSISTDGVTWSTPTRAINYYNSSWKSIAYNGSNKYVALHQSGYVSTSTDGLTWTTPTALLSATNYIWCQLFYNGEYFVAMAVNQGYTWYSISTDGTTWGEKTYAGEVVVSGDTKVAYNTSDSKYVVVAGSNIYTSSNGLSWNKGAPIGISMNNIYSIACIDESLSLINYYGQIAYATGAQKLYTTYTAGDGISINSGIITNTHLTTAWGELSGDISNQPDLTFKLKGKQNKLVAGTGVTLQDTTIDEWTTPSYSSIQSMYYALVQNPLNYNEYFLINYHGDIYSFNNGVVTSAGKILNNNISINNCMDATLVGNLQHMPPFEIKIFVLLSNGVIAISYAPDPDFGIWDVVDTGFGYTYGNWRNIVYNSDSEEVVIFSEGGYMSSSNSQGSSWTTPVQSSPFNGIVNSCGRIAYGNNKYVAIKGYNNYLYTAYSTDGTTWSTPEQINLITNAYDTYAFSFDGNYFVYINNDGKIIKSSDGINWILDSTDTNLSGGNWKALAFDGTGFASTKAVLSNYYGTVSSLQSIDATIISCT